MDGLERALNLLGMEGEFGSESRERVVEANEKLFALLFAELKQVVKTNHVMNEVENTKKMKTANKKLLKKAVRGDIKSQFTLAISFHFGKGQTKSYANALYWYYCILSSGTRDLRFRWKIMNNVGVMHHRGAGLDKSDLQALKWWTCAELEMHAEKGGKKRKCPGKEYVNFNLATLAATSKDEDIHRDDIALKRFMNASSDPVALNNVGVMLARGLGSAANFTTAEFWFQDAFSYEGHVISDVAEHNLRLLNTLGCIKKSDKWQIDSEDCESAFVRLRHLPLSESEDLKFVFVLANRVCRS